MKLIKDIIQGAGHLEGYGYHPGTGSMLSLIVIVGIVGIQTDGLNGFIGGAIFGAIVFLPFWIYGCVERARAYHRRGISMFNSLKD